jgi:hypothetical protein
MEKEELKLFILDMFLYEEKSQEFTQKRSKSKNKLIDLLDIISNCMI